jgi:hypothetical protein
LPGGEIEKGLSRSFLLMMNLGTIDERHRPLMSAGQRINEGLPLTQAVNLCGIDEFHQEMPGPVISRSSLR